MKLRNVFETMVVAFVLGAFAAGPASAETAEEIIVEFCDEAARLANHESDELDDARTDLRRCRREFSRCRDGDFIGDDDPLVQCLSRGLTCTAGELEDRADACNEFAREFRDSYDDALSDARRDDVEDEVQTFFNTDSAARDECLEESAALATRCALPRRAF